MAALFLQVITGKTLEQALMEVLEEEELANLRHHQDEFDRIRNAGAFITLCRRYRCHITAYRHIMALRIAACPAYALTSHQRYLTPSVEVAD